jgi:hypothetical protein
MKIVMKKIRLKFFALVVFIALSAFNKDYLDKYPFDSNSYEYTPLKAGTLDKENFY